MSTNGKDDKQPIVFADLEGNPADEDYVTLEMPPEDPPELEEDEVEDTPTPLQAVENEEQDEGEEDEEYEDEYEYPAPDDEFRQQLAEERAQRLALQQRFDELQRRDEEREAKLKHREEIDALESKLKTARNKFRELAKSDNPDDIDGRVDAQLEVTEITAQLEAARRNPPKATAPAPQSQAQPQPQPQQQPQAMPELARQYMRANTWIQKNEAATNTLNRVAEALVVQGYDPEAREFYTELTRQLNIAKKNGQLKVRVKDLAKPKGKTRAAPSEATTTSTTGRRFRPRTKLDNTDIQGMKLVKMDPNNKAHRDQWLRERNARERVERAGAR